ADGVTLPTKLAIKPAEVRALVPGDQRFRQVRRHVEGVVPAATALRDVRPDARNRHVQNGQRSHRLRRSAREHEGARPAPVVADEMESVELEALAHFREIAADALLVVARGSRAVAESWQVGGDYAIAIGEERNQLAPLMPRLRPTVQQHDWHAGTGGDNVQRDARELECMVLQGRQTTAP